jgi:hypothetical protein
MKTVSTKLDAKSCNYLRDIADREGSTVSDVLRNMVDRCQNEGGQDKIYVDNEGRQKVDQFQNESRLCLEVSPETYTLVSNLAEKRGWSISDTVTHLYNSYPWHVLGCEKCQRNILDQGVIISKLEDLSDMLNKERAIYYVKGANKVKISKLPEIVRSLIRVE